MVNAKFKKHALIAKRRLNQKSEISNMLSFDNDLLKLFISAFMAVKKQNFTRYDSKVFARSEVYRLALLKSKQNISYNVFGLDTTATVMDICAKAASKPKWCQLLYVLINHLNTPKVLEIGTNLGISGTYILEAIKDKSGFFTTMEGLPELCTIARKQFTTITSPNNFEVIQGLYNDSFPNVLKNKHLYNFIFIDGNHKKKPTLHYFNQLKLKTTSATIFVFDDIYWSNEMKAAWCIIKSDIDVNFTIDMYEQGIAIIDKNEKTKNQHFSLHLSY